MTAPKPATDAEIAELRRCGVSASRFIEITPEQWGRVLARIEADRAVVGAARAIFEHTTFEDCYGEEGLALDNALARHPGGDLEARAKRMSGGYLIAVVKIEDHNPASSLVIERPDGGVDWERLMREQPEHQKSVNVRVQKNGEAHHKPELFREQKTGRGR
jgi:hypothetical protein